MNQPHRPDTAIRPQGDVRAVALARLIAEVSGPTVKAAAGQYNRTYNRHNR